MPWTLRSRAPLWADGPGQTAARRAAAHEPFLHPRKEGGRRRRSRDTRTIRASPVPRRTDYRNRWRKQASGDARHLLLLARSEHPAPSLRAARLRGPQRRRIRRNALDHGRPRRPARHVHRPVSAGPRPRPHRRRAPHHRRVSRPQRQGRQRAGRQASEPVHGGARRPLRGSLASSVLATVRPLPSPEVKRLGLVPRTEVLRNGPRRAAAFSSWARSLIAARSSSVNPLDALPVVLLADCCVAFFAGFLSAHAARRSLGRYVSRTRR